MLALALAHVIGVQVTLVRTPQVDHRSSD